MNESEYDKLAAWVDERIEAYVDGDLEAGEQERVAAFVEKDAAAALKLEAARRVRAHFRSFPRHVAPAGVAEAVLDQVRHEDVRRDREALPRARPARQSEVWTRLIRPTLLTSVFILLVTASILVRRPADVDVAASPAEVEQALAEVKWTLAFVSDVGRRTGQSIRREIIEERVSEPVQRALDEALRHSRAQSPGGAPRS